VAQSKALEILQNKRTLNIIFPGVKNATNLIIANVKTVTTTATLTAYLPTVMPLDLPLHVQSFAGKST